MTDDGDELEVEAVEFATDLYETLLGVLDLDGDEADLDVDLVPSLGAVVVRHDGLPLKVEGRAILRLSVNYRLAWRSSDDHRLAVERSTFKLLVDQGRRPILTVDYLRSPSSHIPASHYNVHAERGDVVWAMSNAGARHQGKARRRAVDEQRDIPHLGQLHLPTGGSRFRPALEDILEFAIVEFGIDSADRAFEAIRAGRRRWRHAQLCAAIGDDPETAADELERQGYLIERPAQRPASRDLRLTSY